MKDSPVLFPANHGKIIPHSIYVQLQKWYGVVSAKDKAEYSKADKATLDGVLRNLRDLTRKAKSFTEVKKKARYVA